MNICDIKYKRELVLLGLEFKGPITAEVLGYVLPARIYTDHDYFLTMNKGKNGWGIWYTTNRLGLQVIEDEIMERRETLFHTFRREYNIADAMASYLIMLINASALTVDECNEKLARFSG